jgi:hypothetical protein
MPAGRPTKYKRQYCDEMVEYFSVEPYTVNPKTKKKEASDIPSMAGFASKIGVCKDTLIEWKDVHAEFSAAYKKAKALQEKWLIVNGLQGAINTPFGIFVLKNLQDYKDKTESEVKNSDSVKLIIERSKKKDDE